MSEENPDNLDLEWLHQREVDDLKRQVERLEEQIEALEWSRKEHAKNLQTVITSVVVEDDVWYGVQSVYQGLMSTLAAVLAVYRERRNTV